MAGPPLDVFVARTQRSRPISMVSLYDAPSASICCDAGVDALLVGDSLGNVILGHASTIPVTIDDMVRHTSAVARGARASSRPLVPVVADLPFATYHGSGDSTVRHGAALMQAGAHALKLEGGGPVSLRSVRRLTQMGAPVMGHLGFTPQSALKFREVVQGKTAASAARLLNQARRLEDAGCFAMVLEAMAAEVAEEITGRLAIPTIGIGAGAHCDGQVLVWHDLAGLHPTPPFRFVKRYAEAHVVLTAAARSFASEVASGAFPSSAHSWSMPPEELQQWRRNEPELDGESAD